MTKRKTDTAAINGLFEEGTAAPKPEKTAAAEKKTGSAIVKARAAPSMLEIIASAAANPMVDVGKMQALLAMQKDILAEEARMAFTRDYIAMRSQLPIIKRDGKIDIAPGPNARSKVNIKSRYATYENIMTIVGPILRDHGFAYWGEPDIGNSIAPIIMRCHLDHVGGHGKQCAIPLPFETSGAKNNLQGVGSSLSYGRRYGIMNLCNIISYAPEDRDADGQATTKVVEHEQPVTITDAQAEHLLQKIDRVGIEATRFMDKFKLKAIKDLSADQFEEANSALDNYAAESTKRRSEGKAQQRA